MASTRSRRTAFVLAVLTVSGAAGLSWYAARSAADFIEDRARQDVSLALTTAGHEWVRIETDGLQVRLSGTAPSEVARFRAVNRASATVDASRIVDETSVEARDALAPPSFKIEMLRNDQGISLIGLVPADTNREALLRSLRSASPGVKVTDLLETADYPVPEGWADALDFGRRAAQMAARAKISISPSEVHVTALADSRSEKGRLETELLRALPKGVQLVTDISTPRPVVAPFTLRFLIDDEGARFDACAADTEAAQTQILDAAVRAGVKGTPGCTLALGAPSPDWGRAATAAIKAIAALGKGSVTISDTQVALTAPAEVAPDAFADVTADLQRILPPVFTLQAQHEANPDAQEGPVQFQATLSSDGSLLMQGRATDQRMRQAIDSFARARFGQVQGNLRNDDSTPPGWTVRVIAALEAMEPLAQGSVRVTPEVIALSGTSGDPRATERAAAILSQRLGPGADYQLSIRYDRWLDPALALPDGPYCVDQLNTIMSESEIGFDPGKSTIAGDPAPTLDRLAEVMETCADYQIEAGGHTDSQGSEGFNAELSRARAQAVVKAMEEAGIDTTNLTSRGYGESQPIASNDTEAGREENRRIEFRLLSDRPVQRDPLPAPIVVNGVTSSAPAVEPKPDPVPAADAPAEPAPQQDVGTGSTAPATLGVAEQFQTLEEREANMRLPVQIADDQTPRPAPRPDEAVSDEAASPRNTADDEATAE